MFILILSSLAVSHAQSAIEHYKKGKEYYDNDYHREALYHFKKFIALDQSNAEVYKWRGNCYLEVNQIDSAQADFEKALKINPALHEVNFNLGLVFHQRKEDDKAIRAVTKFVKAKPEDIPGLTFLSSLLEDINPDSSRLLLVTAFKLDPTNKRVIDGMIRDALNRNDLNDVLEFGQLALDANPELSDLLELLAYTAYEIHRYQESITWTDSLIARKPESLGYRVLKIKNQIMLQTSPDILQLDSGIVFKQFSSFNISKLDSMVRDPGSEFHYEKLITKFRTQSVMSLDEYFMTYYGFTTDSHYSPYGTQSPDVGEAFDQEDYNKVIKICEDAIRNDEMNPETYQYLGIAQFRAGMMDEATKNLTRYIGIIESILATGNGKTPATARIVTSAHHEYEILQYLGLRSKMQALSNSAGHSFDILTIEAQEDQEKKIYFNIDKPFGSLGDMFKDMNNKPKKKKKGKKNKA
jgi:tetratricopeptide (TPR) repeat protein